MLCLGLAARDFGSTPAKLLGLNGDLAALDLNLACSLRLLLWDNKREFDRVQAFKEAVRVGTIEAWDSDAAKAAHEARNRTDEPQISEDDIL